MRRSYLLISAAWLLYTVAWFLPVVQGEVTFPKALPGWEAFRAASSAVSPDENFGTFDKWYYAVLSTISAITTPLFVLGSVWVVLHKNRTLRRTAAWTATFAFVVNAHWYVLSGSDRKDLRIGYFFWWWSFLLVALGLFELSRKTTNSASLPPAKLQAPD